MSRLSPLVLLTLLTLSSFPSARAEQFRLDSVGARFGISISDRPQEFKEAEAFVYWKVPVRWDLFCDLHIQWRLDLAAGWLSGRGDDSALVKVGPSGVLQRPGFPISLEAGCSPTLLTRDAFGSEDFGTPFQFSSHLGANWDLGRHWRVAYRFQHMSNGHLADENSGLNLHMLSASWRF